MLKDLIASGFGEDMDLNCAEKVFYGANQVYKLGLPSESLKLAAGFGGGMGIESVCGALTASVMVLSQLFVKKNAHESVLIKDICRVLFSSYTDEMSEIDCDLLKKLYRTEEKKCFHVILKAAEILDRIVESELNSKTRADALADNSEVTEKETDASECKT